MSVFHNSALIGASGQTAAGAGYTIDQSLRTNSSNSAYLSRTAGVPTASGTWTFSVWVKRAVLGTNTGIFSGREGGDATQIYFQTDNTLRWYEGGADMSTTAVFRDGSAWSHFVFVKNGSTSCTIYHNGIQIQQNTTSIPATSKFNTDTAELFIGAIGLLPTTITYYGDHYLAEVNFIDGTALAPTDFGGYDINNVWQPIEYTGSYTGNSFYLKFANGDGTDSSGLSNTWTANNFTTSGTGTDVMSDTPTTNWCTLNPLSFGPSNADMYEGNLRFDQPSSTTGNAKGTIAVSSGKWYWEVTPQTTSTANVAGGILGAAETDTASQPGNYATGYSYYSTGETRHNGVDATYGDSYGAGDVIGTALDLDAGTLVFYKNGVSQGTAYSGISGTFVPAIGDTSTSSSSALVCNFGQRAFNSTAPSGFKALCTANLPDPTIADGSTAFDIALYGGGASSYTISGLAFSPDLVWSKRRDSLGRPAWVDTVRGATKQISCDRTEAEITISDGLEQFNSDGYVVGTDNGEYGWNGGASSTFVNWIWDAGSSTVSNTDGSISSSVRANASAGFSIATYTGSGTAGDSFGHGLGVAPELVIIKGRTNSVHWRVFHKYVNASAPEDYIIYLSSTSSALGPSSGNWNSTAPSSSVVTLSADSGTNASGVDFVAYCWAPVEGYSAFGSYTGNGATGYPNADGPFVFTGMRPRWLLIKATSGSESWRLYDTERSSYNYADDYLVPSSSDAEVSSAANREIDFLSNGFKHRGNNGGLNTSGVVYVWAAFAEHPFKYARAR